MKVGQDVMDEPVSHILVRLLCQMKPIPADAFIWIWTNRCIWTSTSFCQAKVIITSSTTAWFLHRFNIKSYPLIARNPKKKDILHQIQIFLKFVRSGERLTKKESIMVNRLESIVIITIYYNNVRIFFSQIFKSLFELIIVIH